MSPSLLKIFKESPVFCTLTQSMVLIPIWHY